MITYKNILDGHWFCFGNTFGENKPNDFQNKIANVDYFHLSMIGDTGLCGNSGPKHTQGRGLDWGERLITS